MERMPVVTCGLGKSQGKLWVALIAEKALKQICPATKVSSGVAVRTTISGRAFCGMLWSPLVGRREV